MLAPRQRLRAVSGFPGGSSSEDSSSSPGSGIGSGRPLAPGLWNGLLLLGVLFSSSMSSSVSSAQGLRGSSGGMPAYLKEGSCGVLLANTLGSNGQESQT